MINNINFIQKLTSPNPFALVSTRKPDGTTNLMALSWWTYVSNHPATLTVSISMKAYTNSLIRENKEFGLNVVDASLQQSAFACGTCSGRDENKPVKFGISLVEPKEIEAKIVEAHKVALECRLVNIVDTADHSIFIGKILACHTNPERNQLYAVDGYNALDANLDKYVNKIYSEK